MTATQMSPKTLMVTDYWTRLRTQTETVVLISLMKTPTETDDSILEKTEMAIFFSIQESKTSTEMVTLTMSTKTEMATDNSMTPTQPPIIPSQATTTQRISFPSLLQIVLATFPGSPTTEPQSLTQPHPALISYRPSIPLQSEYPT